MTTTTVNYKNMSGNGISWINDLRRAPESGFPDINPNNMTPDERDALVSYLRADDGSLSEEDMEFSNEVADELEELEEVEVE